MDATARLLTDYLKKFPTATIQKGIALYRERNEAIFLEEKVAKRVFYTVPSQSDNFRYDVSIGFLKSGIKASCDCPAFSEYGLCKHILAAGMTYLKEELDINETELEQELLQTTTPAANTVKTAPLTFPGYEPDTDIAWRVLQAEPNMVFYAVSQLNHHHFSSWKWMSSIKMVKLSTETETPQWDFEYRLNAKSIYRPQLQYDRYRTFYYRCDCGETYELCMHVKAAFEIISYKEGRAYFNQFRDRSEERAKLLATIGLRPEDPEAKSVVFSEDYLGNLTVKPPEWLWKAEPADDIKRLRQTLAGGQHIAANRPQTPPNVIIDFEIGFFFDFTSLHFKNSFELGMMKIFPRPASTQFKKINLHQPDNFALLKSLPDDIYQLITSLSDQGIKEHLAKVGHGYITQYSNPWQHLTAAAEEEVRQHYSKQIFRLWPYLCTQPVYVLREGKFSGANIAPAKLSAGHAMLYFKVTEDERFVAISIREELAGNEIKASEKKVHAGFILELDDTFYLPAALEDMAVLKQFRHGYIMVPAAARLQVARSVLPVLQQRYRVEIPPSLTAETIEAAPLFQVLLREYEERHLLLPATGYLRRYNAELHA